MKCTNKRKALRKFSAGLLSFLILISLTACSGIDYSVGYGSNEAYSLMQVNNLTGEKADAFASDLCVIESDVLGDGSINLLECGSAVLIDLDGNIPVYCENAFETLYPASLTKIMTALIAIKYGQSDQLLIASDAVRINESGAQLIGINPGDSMTMHQALRLLLLYSANDVALLIAENVGGSVDGFVNMMNEEAIALGATGTHFTNPHGLTDTDHYTTAYDLYLIFNECIKYDEFKDIISTATYETSYTNKAGKEVHVSVKNTNGYVSGTRTAPTNVNVVGGKTGTTSAAGHCLIILAQDINGSPYICVVLKSDSNDTLYQNMSTLLEEI